MRTEMQHCSVMYRFSMCAAWLSFILGIVAFWSMIGGYERSLVLPDVPRPHVGPGFSESATAALGGALIGWWLAAAGVATALIGLATGRRRLFKLLLAIPAGAYVIAPYFLVR